VTKTNDPSPAARRGYLVLLGLFLGFAVVFTQPALLERLRPEIRIVALVTDASGVVVGTPVWVEGIRVGRVKNVQIARLGDSTLIALDLRLEPRARTIITADSDVRVARRRLVGEATVRIAAGHPGSPAIQEGDTLVGQPRATPQEFLATAEAIPSRIHALMAAARQVEAQIEVAEPRLRLAGEQLRAATAATAALVAEIEAIPLGAVPERVGALRAQVLALGDAAADLVARYSPDADDGLMAEVRQVARRAQAVELALAGLQTRFEEGEGFLPRLQQDAAIDREIEGIQAQIDSLMSEAWSLALRMFLP
jgi:ABC-type transporter Mla subunit MlaD